MRKLRKFFVAVFVIDGLNKLICVIVILSFALALGGLFAYEAVKDAQYKARVEYAAELARPFEEERRELLGEKMALETNLFKEVMKTHCGSTVSLFFLEPHKALYTMIFPTFNGTYTPGEYVVEEWYSQYPMVGTICVTDSDMPGTPNAITVAQYREMESAGWELAVRVPKEIDTTDRLEFTNYLNDVKVGLEAHGIAMPKTVYFDVKLYSSKDCDGILGQFGISYIVHHEEQDENGKAFPTIGTLDEAGLGWRVGDVGWNNASRAPSLFATLGRMAGNIVFSFTFDTSDVDYSRLIYDMDDTSTHEARTMEVMNALHRMLNNEENLRGGLRDGRFHIDTLPNAKKYYSEYYVEYSRRKPELETKRAELTTQISALEAKIAEIYSGIY